MRDQVTEAYGTSGDRSIWNIRYADDTTLIEQSKKECELMASTLIDASLEVGLHINQDQDKIYDQTRTS